MVDKVVNVHVGRLFVNYYLVKQKSVKKKIPSARDANASRAPFLFVVPGVNDKKEPGTRDADTSRVPPRPSYGGGLDDMSVP